MNNEMYGTNNASDGGLNKLLAGTKDFMNSNSIISNFVFIILVLIVFLVVLQMSIQAITYYFKPSGNPKLIDGMVSTSNQLEITQNPYDGTGPLLRSVNEREGLEFSWSSWIYINTLKDTSTHEYQHVYSKGSNTSVDVSGIALPNNGPGVYLKSDTNELRIVMDTFDESNNSMNEHVEIDNIPMKKWVHVVVMCKNRYMDVYINGDLSKRKVLINVPQQNYGNTFVGLNGGYDGYLSNLWYYNYALSVREIRRLFYKGPNMKMKGSMELKKKDYLSLNWFINSSSEAD